MIKKLIIISMFLFSVIMCALPSFAKSIKNIDGNEYFINDNNEIIINQIVLNGEDKYYVDLNGIIQKKYFLEEAEDGNAYYFGRDGKMMKDSWLCIQASKVENKGTVVPYAYWYYFKPDGKAIKAGSGGIKKATIDGKKYLFNEYGQMLTGFVDADGNMVTFADNENPFAEATYYCGDENDGQVHTGWLNYPYGYNTDDDDDYRYKLNSIYLYFNPENGKKITGKKVINHNEYLFNDEGLMVTAWDAYEQQLTNEAYYYGEQDDGAKAKGKWLHIVPSYLQDYDNYADDEEKYFYFTNDGKPVENQIKKINKDYYAFDDNGIMQTGLVLYNKNKEYIGTVDFDYASFQDFMQRGELILDDEKVIYLNYDGTASVENSEEKFVNSGNVSLHYFVENGERKIGKSKVNFSDNDGIFYSNTQGQKSSGVVKDNVIVNGFVATALDDAPYAIAVTNEDLGYKAQAEILNENIALNNYAVVDGKGKIVKANKIAYKDDADNYWLIGGESKIKRLKGIWTQNVKWSSGTNYSFDDIYYFKDANNVSNDEILCFLETAGYIDLSIFYDNISSFDLKVEKTKNEKEYIIKLNNVKGYMYFNENSTDKNKWTPCGVKDKYNKTISVNNYSQGDYQTILNDSFFANCYWQ